MNKIILWVGAAVCSVGLFIVGAFLLMNVPQIIPKILTKFTGIITLSSFLFGSIFVTYILQQMESFKYKMLLQLLTISTFSSYFLMYFAYMFLDFEVKYPHVSGIGFDICTINCVLLVIIFALLKHIPKVKKRQ